MPEGLTIKTLSDGSGVLEFFPPDYAVAHFTKLEYFKHVSSWFERYYEYRVIITDRVSLSILVSCIIFTVWMSLAASSSRTSSSRTLRGMPFSTCLG